MKEKTYPRLRIIKVPNEQPAWHVLRQESLLGHFPYLLVTRCFTFKGACEYAGEYLDEMKELLDEGDDESEGRSRPEGVKCSTS